MSQKRKGKSTKKPNYRIAIGQRALIEYWRDSLLEQSRIECSTELEEARRIEVPHAAVKSGQLSTDVFKALQAQKKQEKLQSSPSSLPIVISPLNFHCSSQSKRSKQHLLLYIPALLQSDGRLLPHEHALPWIPRAYLEPSPRSTTPSIGTVVRVDAFFKKFPSTKFSSFPEYLKYCARFLKFVTNESIASLELEGCTKSEYSTVALFQQGRANQAQLRILNEVLLGIRNPGMLTTLATLSPPKRKLYGRSKARLASNAKLHLGHFSPKFSLSSSQRQAVARYLETPNAEVYSLNGPPGTGKTTVLQSMIASPWVAAAYQQKTYPPVQVVCGATNQSVLNVIDSFAQNAPVKNPLCQRWIPQLRSYATFCSSFTRAEHAQQYQLALTNGSGLFEELESEDELHRANDAFLQRCSSCIQAVTTPTQAKKIIHRLLKKEVEQLHTEVNRLLNMQLYDYLLANFRKLSPEDYEEAAKCLQPLDSGARYRCFILATHYWEARWLETILSQKSFLQKKSDKASTKQAWAQKAMLTPVFVSTLSMAGRFFGLRENRDEPCIDSLFFDEGGQITPEQAAAVTALAEKVTVIGDTAQLAPFSLIPHYIDSVNLEQSRVPVPRKTDPLLAMTRLGVAASTSSLMQRAVSCCAREDGQTIGGALYEHRRSTPSIIGFCNELSYQGRLKPLRPELKSRILPAFGFVPGDSPATKVGPSRKNTAEAQAVVWFLNEQKKRFSAFYQNRPIEDILAILTPFTAQAKEIRAQLGKTHPDLIVGTVHSLQGAEREIVLFSSTYDAQHKAAYIFDTNPRLLNVAVSRAKDSFIVFGAKTVFQNHTSGLSPASLLGRYLFSSPENILGSKRAGAPDRSGADKNPEQQKRIATLDEHRSLLHNALQNAEDKVLIASPTISIRAIESDNLLPQIEAAVSRGVEVTVFTDSQLDASDGKLKENAARGREALQNAGAKLFVADRIHNKSLAMDTSFIVEGSFNWLSAVRSAGGLHQKHETSYLIQGEVVAKLVKDLHEEMYSRLKTIH